jgi:coupling of ubiquitin conjugation to ER degradation protein 1
MPSTPTARATPTRPKSTHPDLITRYNLSSKLTQSPETPPDSDSAPESGKKPKQAWSNNKNERQALLQKRREDMILAARRKMEEAEKKAKT